MNSRPTKILLLLLILGAAGIGISRSWQLSVDQTQRGAGHDEHEHEHELDHDHEEHPALDHNADSPDPADLDHEAHEHEEDGHEQDDHDDEHGEYGHEDHEHLDLSEQAQGNIGVEIGTLAIKSYHRSIAVPALVVERPGISRVEVSAPLTGIVTRVQHTTGESVGPGKPLFSLRLTHEELVQLQREFLAALEELDVVNREIDRLDSATQSGAVAGKTLLARQYEQQKVEGRLKAMREALLLHGLSAEMVDMIQRDRKLVPEIEVYVPDASFPSPMQGPRCCFTIQKLTVSVGKHVEAGETMAVLTDYTQLYIEGRAFQNDAAEIENAAAKNWSCQAQLDGSGDDSTNLADLEIAYVANEVDVDTRALHFYVDLPNELSATHERDDGRLYTQWKYRPGMRGELFVPAERWEDQLVVPSDAVIQEGAESFVFLVHAGHYDRTPVRVLQRDPRNVVLQIDEQVKPGVQCVFQGAYQMHLAMKNRSGGGIDPHAGHNH